MYTIGQVSEMFGLPISTLRYYDKEGLFPGLERRGGIRLFGDNELEALRVIECLKQSGLEIRDIKQFFAWVAEGSSTYANRKALFEHRRAAVARWVWQLMRPGMATMPVPSTMALGASAGGFRSMETIFPSSMPI